MIKQWIFTLALALSIPLLQTAQAATNPHQVVAKVNQHVLKQYQVNQLLQLANFLAASAIKPQHQQLLRRWAVEDFRNSPASTSVFYQEVARDFLPKIQQLKRNRKALETYRAGLYQKIYRVFQSDPAMKRWNHDLMDVVGWYKPPQGKVRQAQRTKKPQPKRRVVRKQAPKKPKAQTAQNAAATQLQQTLAYMAAVQRSQAIFRQRSAALAYQNAMSQRARNLSRIQSCQIAGNCAYRYEYVPR